MIELLLALCFVAGLLLGGVIGWRLVIERYLRDVEKQLDTIEAALRQERREAAEQDERAKRDERDAA